MKSQWGYRPAIDGLRALAIVSVILFHFDRAVFGAGFIGVDVFFVISGYLITSILLSDMEAGRFSIARFYQRRIARIFPVFFIVLSATIIAGSMIYSAQDFASLGANAAAAALSLINMKLLFQGTYFKISQDAQPLLHYWSLAVEEQFYVVFPLYLFCVTRLWRRALSINLLLSFISFAICVAVTRYNPTYAFYLFPTRAWELLLGSSLAIAEQRQISLDGQAGKFASWSGIAILATSLILIRDHNDFPGWIAFFPVAGTVLILATATQGKLPVTRLLSSVPAVMVGRLSYSLYLWHWPTFSFVDYEFFQCSDVFRGSVKIAVTVIASIITFFLVERPLRAYLSGPKTKILAFSGMAVAVGLVVSVGVRVRDQEYFNASPSQIASGGKFIDGGNNGSIVLAGDSQGSMYGKVLVQFAHENKLGPRLIKSTTR